MDTKNKLVKLATEKYGSIKPCSQFSEFTSSSFTEEDGVLLFWFNDQSDSTHIVSELDLDAVYIATELSQIHKDYEESGSDLSEDEYAVLWIKEHGEEYAHSHNRV